jgi:hypothetical protein
LIWGVEIEFDLASDASIFHSAQRVILDGDCVQIQLLDGTYEVHPIARVRKILSMRAKRSPVYTDEDVSTDELY